MLCFVAEFWVHRDKFHLHLDVCKNLLVRTNILSFPEQKNERTNEIKFFDRQSTCQVSVAIFQTSLKLIKETLPKITHNLAKGTPFTFVTRQSNYLRCIKMTKWIGSKRLRPDPSMCDVPVSSMYLMWHMCVIVGFSSSILFFSSLYLFIIFLCVVISVLFSLLSIWFQTKRNYIMCMQCEPATAGKPESQNQHRWT